jgi:hypothetical protein
MNRISNALLSADGIQPERSKYAKSPHHHRRTFSARVDVRTDATARARENASLPTQAHLAGWRPRSCMPATSVSLSHASTGKLINPVDNGAYIR